MTEILLTETFFNEPLQNMCLLYGFFGGLLGSLCMGWLCFPSPSQETRLGAVDRKVLIATQSERAVKDLGEDLKTFATAHNLILLTKETVMGGAVPDQTTAFLEWLKQKEQGDQS